MSITTAGTVTASAFSHVKGIETIDLADGTNAVTLADALIASADARALTVNGGCGNDTITASTVAAGRALVLDGGAGNDTFVFTAAGFSAADTIAGGTGQDTLRFTTAGALTDSAFANVTGIEVVTLANGANSLAVSDALVASADAQVLTIVGGSGDDVIEASSVLAGHSVVMVANAGSDTLTGGAGADRFAFTAAGLSAADTVSGGAGTDTLAFTTAGTVTADAFANVTGIEALTLANGTNHLTLSDALVAASDSQRLTVTGGSGGDTVDASAVLAGRSVVFSGNAGNDTFIGGAGDDTFIHTLGGGSDTVIQGGSIAGGVDTVAFGANIAIDQLWFHQNGNDLQVSVIGMADKVVVKDWYLDAADHVQQFQTQDGHILLDNEVANLVSAMASLAPPPAGQMTLSAAQAAQLEPVIAANWH